MFHTKCPFGRIQGLDSDQPGRVELEEPTGYGSGEIRKMDYPQTRLNWAKRRAKGPNRSKED